ncbi:MAG: hypothetical protein QOE32_3821, partial [Pseudonocardiales bacterium]|nr:hypothetical protein [Pseudonocardiales bacterium]
MHIRRVVPGDLSVTITDSSVSAAAAMPPVAVSAAIVPATSVLTPWSRGSVPARRVGVLLLRGY